MAWWASRQLVSGAFFRAVPAPAWQDVSAGSVAHAPSERPGSEPPGFADTEADWRER
jgi:hypothetical protein